jgi:cytochrome oxidase Cu insertion factor (SCO1/SenC/PrrC family)
LTVTAMTAPTTSILTGRSKLLLLALLFILPIVLAVSLYMSGWRPGATVNHGELLSPARPIADGMFQTLDGKATSFSELGRKKWSLVYFGPSECLNRCAQNLYKMRQVHLAQGKEAERVQRVFVATDAKALDRLRHTLMDYPGMIALIGPEAAVRELARQFNVPAGSALDGLDRIYLVDPLGNFMLHYAPDADASGMRKDLVRLLKVSQVG